MEASLVEESQIFKKNHLNSLNAMTQNNSLILNSQTLQVPCKPRKKQSYDPLAIESWINDTLKQLDNDPQENQHNHPPMKKFGIDSKSLKVKFNLQE